MGEASNVMMGVCSLTFGGVDLGYTSGGVKVSYSADTVEKNVDQEDAPIDEVVTKQSFEVVVPLLRGILRGLRHLCLVPPM